MRASTEGLASVVRGIALAAAALTVGGVATAQNDECAGAITLLDGLNLGVGFTTIGATPSGLPNPTCAGTVAFNSDVWFTYTATCSGAVTITMCGNPNPVFDSLLAVYTGGCGGLTSIVCDDDGCPTPPAFADVSVVTTPVVAAGTVLTVRVGGFSALDTGTFELTVSCAVPPPPTTDFGDAPANVAAHTSATLSERLGTAVTGEAATLTPSWYGDSGDDGIVSVADLFPGSATATIVVSAINPGGPFTDFCRIWVDRNSGIGWSTVTDALPTQTASVGPGGTLFTFGPFTYSASAPASPMVRVRLSFNTTGVSSSLGTGSFGEVEDYVLPGTGGPVSGATGTAGQDAGDAPIPYPPCNSTNILSERLGLAVTDDATAPVGPDAGAAAWDDDTDDGVVAISGLTPGGSCSIVVRASDPLGTFSDTIAGWIDFDNDGNWDEAGEVFAPVTVAIGPVASLVTLGPLAVPVTASVPFPTRLKISFGTQGGQTAGMAFTFGEVEDYLLPEQTSTCGGCNTTGGAAGTLAATTAASLGGSLTLVTNGAPSASVLTVFGRFAGSGADLSGLGAPIAPGLCFLCVLPQIIFGGGATNAGGTLVQSFPVPNDPAFTGVDVNFQNFQILIGGGFNVVNTNSLSTTVLP